MKIYIVELAKFSFSTFVKPIRMCWKNDSFEVDYESDLDPNANEPLTSAHELKT